MKRYSWLFLLAGLVLVNILASKLHVRVDMTQEKRFSLSEPTRRILRELDSPVFVEVYLKGDFPAVFRNLASATGDLLREMQDESGGRLVFRFIKPGEGLPDSLQARVFDSLSAMGLKPYTLTVSAKPGEESSQRTIFPAAVVRYGDKAEPVDLSNDKGDDAESRINNAESLLEFKFANAIHLLSRKKAPRIAYLLGNGEPMDLTSFDAITTLARNYVTDTLNLFRIPFIPEAYSAVVITKPLQAFSEFDKLKIDQYVMRGGKVLWLIDNLYAEMDSLRQTNQFVAFDRGLNLGDQLFRYGVRINYDLVQDMQCDQVPLAVGTVGGKPQMQLVPWPYFPLLNPSDDHPITKNLDPVLGTFVNSIDTVKAVGIKKTILLSTSNYSRILSTPAIVSWESVKQAPDPAQYNLKGIPAGVLLEGAFHSFYENRLPSAFRDSLQAMGRPFVAEATVPAKMIVVADGDLILNAVSRETGPLPMGTNPYTQDQYANKDFFQNAVAYLTDSSGVIETRNKQLVLRSLDRQKVEDERLQWQLINIVLPILLVILGGGIYQQIRKRQYQR
ncbi:gliding motility-associated ABC transporter substrate-binding protein GldG [Dinghuibacter silviterrae]|uniref:Gliding-associated putative ABC transporter substrate-binding component GldG n=1 Tax=Dinghuibacter silviterrae TaxID=1539049 RepID=A0A4R8DMX2_9BACT|nr:gliding motility-associated ABC transporter substrate-binding protein GldG [Dinghuibacter silviterrae]TDW99351.1 gliding-associated putative ABC transporter substrate-binding component GldG [Dinghuibacter silviterrae]